MPRIEKAGSRKSKTFIEYRKNKGIFTARKLMVADRHRDIFVTRPSCIRAKRISPATNRHFGDATGTQVL
jgi:hypothetical protein